MKDSRPRVALALAIGFALCPALALGREPETDPAKVVETGVYDRRLESFDRLMTSFVARNRIPGAALAVTRHGRLVYARGFGFADLDKEEPVKPRALFRIASVSKPLTAVTVLHLIGQDKLRLDSKALDLLGPEIAGKDGPVDPRWKQITVGELLQHRGGWDRGKSFDPMFRSVQIARDLGTEPPTEAEQIIRYMLRKPLDFDPGARDAYSNFGYCVLGRVIEKLTGEPYGAAVHKLVIRPLGIPDNEMRLGHTLPEGRLPGEVHYYENDRKRTVPAVVGRPLRRPVPDPYGGWYLEAMDAHGGWVTSAPALVQFASAFDDPAHCKILSTKGIKTMFACPPGPAGHERGGRPKDAYYACGWQVRPVGKDGANTWHSGSLPGTEALLVRRADGLNWAILFNMRPDGSKSFTGEIDGLLHKAADAVREWPDKKDLFAAQQ